VWSGFVESKLQLLCISAGLLKVSVSADLFVLSSYQLVKFVTLLDGLAEFDA